MNRFTKRDLKAFILEREIVAIRWLVGAQISYFALAAVWFLGGCHGHNYGTNAKMVIDGVYFHFPKTVETSFFWPIYSNRSVKQTPQRKVLRIYMFLYGHKCRTKIHSLTVYAPRARKSAINKGCSGSRVTSLGRFESYVVSGCVCLSFLECFVLRGVPLCREEPPSCSIVRVGYWGEQRSSYGTRSVAPQSQILL